MLKSPLQRSQSCLSKNGSDISFSCIVATLYISHSDECQVSNRRNIVLFRVEPLLVWHGEEAAFMGGSYFQTLGAGCVHRMYGDLA